MGLTITRFEEVADVGFSYSYFNELREKICKVAKVDMIHSLVKVPTKEQRNSAFWLLRNHADNEDGFSWYQCQDLAGEFKEHAKAFEAQYPEDYEFYEGLWTLMHDCAESYGIIEFR